MGDAVTNPTWVQQNSFQPENGRLRKIKGRW